MKYNKENNEWVYNEKELKESEFNGMRTGFGLGVITGMFIMLMICDIVTVTSQKEPSAIDVYRGKTELKVEKTYIGDSISKIDTTIVYKK